MSVQERNYRGGTVRHLATQNALNRTRGGEERMQETLLGNSKSRLDSFTHMCMSHTYTEHLFSYTSHLRKACVTYETVAVVVF